MPVINLLVSDRRVKINALDVDGARARARQSHGPTTP
jgi:hypothetical protein